MLKKNNKNVLDKLKKDKNKTDYTQERLGNVSMAEDEFK